MENVKNRRVVRLFNCWSTQSSGKRGAETFISSGYMKRVIIFTEECVGVELQQKIITFNKPIQIGFTILELAKTKVYEFHYDVMKKLYPNPKQLSLTYTDTDSLIYQIHTDDVYMDLYPIIHDRQFQIFDTSNYATDNPYGYKQVNKSKLGLMKDECAGKQMTTFIGLRAKCYTFKTIDDDKWQNKAKGVKKHITAQLLPDEYEGCVLDREKIVLKKQHVFRSHLHDIYTENLEKCALNGADDKRYIRIDGVNTYAWGHVNIQEEEELKLLEQNLLQSFSEM